MTSSISDQAASADALELMRELLGLLSEKLVTAAHFHNMAARFGIHSISTEISFLTGVDALLRNIPVGAFTDLDARTAVLRACQDALDIAIETEETQVLNDELGS